MSRTSRIPHPPGSRFTSLYHWAVRRFGIGGAAVLGFLDFLDRAQDRPEQPVASRARIIADLEGIVGKHVIDRALQDLAAARVILRHEETIMGPRNWQTRVEYSLDLVGLKQILATPETGSAGKSRFGDSGQLPEPVPDSGVAYKNLEIEEAAAQCLDAPCAAASSEPKRKHPRRTACRIECWYPSEDAAADALEASFPSEQILAAVATVTTRRNSKGNRTSPVPALVAEQLESQQRVALEAERRAGEVAERAAKEKAIPPLEIQKQRIAAISAALRTGKFAQMPGGHVCS